MKPTYSSPWLPLTVSRTQRPVTLAGRVKDWPLAATFSDVVKAGLKPSVAETSDTSTVTAFGAFSSRFIPPVSKASRVKAVCSGSSSTNTAGLAASPVQSLAVLSSIRL